MRASPQLALYALHDFPRVQPGDDIATLLIDCLQLNDIRLESGDVVCLAQKIVSKAENRYVAFSGIEPSQAAIELAAKCAKDPRQAELILRESNEVVRVRPGVVIVEHRLGYVHANAGIDRSNIPTLEGDEQVLLLPENPDASAATLRDSLQQYFACELAVIINDSAGRAWRNGTVGFAIGTAGFEPVESLVGNPDMFGRPLEITEVAVADELAAAASFLMGQADEGQPVVVIRGAQLKPSEAGSRALIREKSLDLFR